MKLGIFSISNAANGTTLLLQAGKKHGLQGVVLSPGDLYLVDSIVDTLDIFIPRFMHSTYEQAIHVTQAAEKARVLCSITAWGITNAQDKWCAYNVLRQHTIPTPETMLLSTVPSAEEVSVFGFPVIIKPRTENQGIGVILAMNPHDAIGAVAGGIGKYGTVILQRFIQEAAGSDRRIFVIGDEVVAAMTRTAQPGEFRANIKQGGKARAYTPSAQEAKLAVEAAKALQAEICGVDILMSNEGPVILEVNGSPGFKIADITGIPVPELCIEYLVHKRTVI